MTDSLILFWHRKDLRLSDNRGLAAAQEHRARVVGVFCLDPKILSGDDIAAVRVHYLMGSLKALQRHYQQVGSELVILQGDPVEQVPSLAQALGATAVYWNSDVEPYAQSRDQAVQTALRQRSIAAHGVWDQLLHEPGTIKTGNGDPYTVYSPFWRNWSRQPKPDPIATLDYAWQGLTEAEQEQAAQVGAIALPTAKDLGFIWDAPLVLEPGEQAAQAQLTTFCDRAITTYQPERNFPANPGTSLLSPALKFGTIGIRTVWAATTAALAHSRSSEAEESIEVWQKELAWREFYQQAMYFFPNLATGPYRSRWNTFPWANQPELFQAWCAGKTGYPIVDAAMRQLNETGWMHNRCRMIVASFLTKDLIIDWRWGERYFMQHLIDGDLSANNGGWQWSASSGMDPRPLRIFNPASQAQKFDAEAEYIRTWLPELRSMDTEELVTGKIPPLEREACGYAKPIVDHHQQQQRFKALYSLQKP